jgi:hypothetical protein
MQEKSVALYPCESAKIRGRLGFLGFNDFAAAQATRADADALADALHFGVDGPQINVPAPLGHVVGVADIVPELRLLPADITNLCHDYSRVLLIEH